MAINEGDILRGTVTNVTKFGAFVKLVSDTVTEEGLVHISEIANEYVSDINDFVKVSDEVEVKVLGRNEKGKLDLSIKQTQKDPHPEILYAKKKDSDFEDKLHLFLKRSEEKQIDIRRNLKQKQGIGKKRR